MRRCSKLCGGGSNADVVEPRPVARQNQRGPRHPPNTNVEEPHLVISTPEGLHMEEISNRQVLRLKLKRRAFSTTAARFCPNGDTHNVVISFDESIERAENMRLAIDGVIVHEMEVKCNFRGNVELNVDGLVVDFLWDFHHSPPKFIFRPRVDGDGPEQHWEEHDESYKLLIFGWTGEIPID